MMTPSELREYEFKGAGRNAYKADDVDIFFGEVAVAYEKLFRENAELVKRVGLLADRLEQFKNDEDQIKQAVIGAQKAADIIIKEAENSIEDSKIEAEAILAAAKGEASIIKSDAEKQAIADSDLLISIARDKAEEIINKAKEEAHGILIEANDSAKDTVGAATRTITSESIHYEMLKKEVSDFRASILAQYKAHIEMISKLPELAIEEAEKQSEEEIDESEINVSVDIVEEINSVDPENNIIEFIEAAEEENPSPSFDEEEEDAEEVVKTTLPYDFFSEETPMEFVEDEVEEEQIPDITEFNAAFENNEENIEFITDEADDNSESEEAFFVEENNDIIEKVEEHDVVSEDIPISRGFSINTESVANDSHKDISSMFSSFETIDDDDVNYEEDKEEPKKRFGFFRKK